MTWFSATNHSQAVVMAARTDVWEVLTDPVLLPRLTPLLRAIEADGDMWRWHLASLSVLGIGIAPVFTEAMTFQEPSYIEYSHRPSDRAERTGADGWYKLEEVEGGTHLEISLTMHVDLPLSRLAGPAVERVVSTVMQRTGDRFAVNLLRHLGAPSR